LSVATNFFLENPNKKEIWENLKKRLQKDDFLLQNVNSFIITENNQLADVVNGKDIKVNILFGQEYIFEKLIIDNKEVTFRVSAFSFFQTNTHQAQVLFETAKNMLSEIK
jgi:tRNA/tmRNA/rRNA uracil-C5-methylase (TrmA/RlmC/RlmD family)